MIHCKLRHIGSLATLILLSGCVIDPYAMYGNPQGRDSGSNTMGAMSVPTGRSYIPNVGDYHIVQRGETLYSISRRYGVDYRHIANRNGIYPPYTIRPGQRLSVY